MLRSARLFFMLALLGGAPALAHEGHDHGEAPALPTVYEPRFEARAGAVEVVGILKADDLWLYASRYADNAPWAGLQLEIEQGDTAVVAAAVEPGVYRAPAGPLGEPGTHAVILSASGEGLEELLTGELVVSEPESADTLTRIPRWGWALGVLAVLVLGSLVLRARSR